MSGESAIPGASQEPAEARWAPYPWWGQVLVSALMVFMGVLGAAWIPRSLPGGPPWLGSAWLVLMVVMAVQDFVQWVRGKRGNLKCSRCGRTVGFAPGVGKAGRQWADVCARCGAHLTFPAER